MKTYLVGGAVRDRLLELEPEERDWVVVGATAEEMKALGFRQVGREFPVFLHPETGEEYALARTERKKGHGYHGFEVHAAPDVTLEEDLRRRDLTINAMAMDPESGEIIDPWGGREDLRQGRLRHVSPAFVEDPVRILRVARFAARFAPWGFRVAHSTHRLMKQMVESGEVDHLVPERVWAETEKALGEPAPERFFEVLRACGALARIFPEIDRLFGVPQPVRHHGEVDTGVHCLMVLHQAAELTPDRRVRFAALVHDLGKGETPPEMLPSHHDHERRGAKRVEAMCRRLKIPNAYRELGMLTARWHSHAHRALKLKPATVLKLLEGSDAFRRPDRFEQFLLACIADARGRAGCEDAPYPQADYLREALEACRGVDLTPLKEAGLKGAEFAGGIRRLRLEQLSALRRNWRARGLITD
ncbi:MAG TPA: multifunctional CCA addition/repair protein [Thiotrichales bacterium]|nr:multifunctional CCA addition/repair protein [Thiotrichales bacterium]